MNEFMVNLLNVWENNIANAIELNRNDIDFSIVSYDELKSACMETMKYFNANEMIGTDFNYSDLVLDIAKTCFW